MMQPTYHGNPTGDLIILLLAILKASIYTGIGPACVLIAGFEWYCRHGVKGR